MNDEKIKMERKNDSRVKTRKGSLEQKNKKIFGVSWAKQTEE